MSTNPKELLEEILSIYSRLSPIGNRAARESAFYPVKYRLDTLKEIMFTDYPGHSQYVDNFSYHSLCALATRPIDGNSPQRHQMWADRALTIIKRALNKDAFQHENN